MVHQHFMLIPVFTVAENVMLGHEETRRIGFLDRRRARRDVEEISKRYRLDVPPDALVADLPVGVQQRVEIIKALSRDARVLILDEPTAVLTPQETDDLIRVMRALRDGGTSIVFITHKLREVREVADRITVIRRGKVVGSALPSASTTELASLMVGRPVQLTVDKGAAKPADVVLDVSGVTVLDEGGVVLVDDVSFQVHGGEIYALAGVQGNGQTEMTEALVGLTIPTSGKITIAGSDVTTLSTDAVLDLGVGYVPEDRLHDGLVGDFSVAENLVLDLYDQPPFASGPAMNLAAIARNATERVDEFDVRTSVDDRVGQHAVGRQPAEGGARAGVVAAVEAADRGAADARPRRRLDGVRAPADRGRARPGRGRRARLHRARRGARAGRPDRRDVPGQDRG